MKIQVTTFVIILQRSYEDQGSFWKKNLEKSLKINGGTKCVYSMLQK